jgi:SNF2 family DNA or RNA helicase
MKNELHFTEDTVRLVVPNAADWDVAKRLGGERSNPSPGIFEYVLSTQSMKRIYEYFPGEKRPVVKSGQQHLDLLQNNLKLYKERREAVKRILAKNDYPVPPNGKFVPYQHQRVGIGVFLSNPYAYGGLDCGTGKTGLSLRAMELVLDKGEITRGKILVSAPLSVMETSWVDDARKFTNLRVAVLWTPMSNKKILSAERKMLKHFGEKSELVVASETKKATVWQNIHTKEIRTEKPNALSGPKDHWLRYHASWKIGHTLEGCVIPYGPMVGRTVSVEETRKGYVADQLKRTDVDVFIINHDGVRIYEEILTDSGLEWTLVDEGTKIKNSSSSITQAHINISARCKRRNVLSGTPNPNGYEDLWSQFYFLDRGLTLEPSKKDFLSDFFYTEVKRYGGIPIAKHFIKSSELPRLVERVKSVGIFLDQRDCIDLPPRTDMDRVVFMTEEQEEAYIAMAKDLVARLRDKVTGKEVQSEAVNILAQICRLRQITSGFLSNRDDELVALSENPKYENIDGLLDELGDKKLLVVCQFTEEIRALTERYKDIGSAAIFGDVKKEDRDEAIRAFQEDPSKRVIMIHPAAAAHGITLTKAAYVMHQSLSYNFDHYYQSIKRVERIGQKNPMFVYRNVARFRNGKSTIDGVLVDVLRRKNDIRNSLFVDQSNEQEMACDFYQQIEEQIKECT